MNSRLMLTVACFVSTVGSVSAAGFLPALPPPTGLQVNAVGCDKVALQWNPVAGNAGYRVRAISGGLATFVEVTGTNATIDVMELETYVFSVQAIGVPNVSRDSGFAVPVLFTAASCVTCTVPKVTLTLVTPTVLWPPNRQKVPVVVSGMIESSCPLVESNLIVKDEYGSDVVTALPVGPDGGPFTVNLALEASRLGSDADGRTYGITATVQNEAGSAMSEEMKVVVPHDRGKK